MERERNKITSVCVYCASSTQVASAYREAATELGHLLGERNLRVINGAGNSGLMCAVSDAALAAGGTVTGVIPRFIGVTRGLPIWSKSTVCMSANNEWLIFRMP